MSREERQGVLEDAIAVTTGNRPDEYGEPEDNFQVIADIWTAIRKAQSKNGVPIVFSAHDVAMFMAGVKLAREANKHSHDNCVDLAGYAACMKSTNEK